MASFGKPQLIKSCSSIKIYLFIYKLAVANIDTQFSILRLAAMSLANTMEPSIRERFLNYVDRVAEALVKLTALAPEVIKKNFILKFLVNFKIK